MIINSLHTLTHAGFVKRKWWVVGRWGGGGGKSLIALYRNYAITLLTKV